MQTKRFNETIDLSGVETFRRYRFASKHYDVDKPISLVVSDDGSHIITDVTGEVHHIANDWLAFESKGHFEYNVIPDGAVKDGGQWHSLPTPTQFVYWYEHSQSELSYTSVTQFYIKDSGSHKLVLGEGYIAYVRPLWTTLIKDESDSRL